MAAPIRVRYEPRLDRLAPRGAIVCPRDRSILHEEKRTHRAGRVRVFECRECEGCFIPADSVRELRERLDLRHSGRADIMSPETGEFPCPQCQSWLQEVHRSGVELDVCVECHGIWFDALELIQLAARSAKAQEAKRLAPVPRPHFDPQRKELEKYKPSYLDWLAWIFWRDGRRRRLPTSEKGSDGWWFVAGAIVGAALSKR